MRLWWQSMFVLCMLETIYIIALKFRPQSRSHLHMKGFGNPNKGISKQQPGGTAATPSSPAYKLKSNPKVAQKTASDHIPTFNLDFPSLRAVYGDPPVFEVDNAFSPDLCQAYMDRAQSIGVKMSSQIFGSSAAGQRTSTTWYLPYKDATELLDVASKLTGLPSSRFEEPQVVRYEMGEQFTWHYDAIPVSLQKSGGNRLGTLLIYLNTLESKSGGATCFKDLDIQVRPEQGKALLFFPCYKDGTPDERTLHCGQMCSDTKWIAQIWIHEKDYDAVTVPRD